MAMKNMKAWLASGGPVAGGPAGLAAGATEIGAVGFLKKMIAGPLAYGLIAKGVADMVDQHGAVDSWMDRHIPGYSFIDRKISNLEGYSDKEWREMRGMDKKGGDLTVNVNVDGQKLTSHVIKGVVDTANGPQTGRGDVDNRRLYTQTEN